jgi:hypothetical protein
MVLTTRNDTATRRLRGDPAGTPLITSDWPYLRELFADTAVYVSPSAGASAMVCGRSSTDAPSSPEDPRIPSRTAARLGGPARPADDGRRGRSIEDRVRTWG